LKRVLLDENLPRKLRRDLPRSALVNVKPGELIQVEVGAFRDKSQKPDA